MKGLHHWQYKELLRQQKGRCAICKAPPELGRRLAADHCHKQGVVRGLLCSRCNLGIGFLEDDLIRHRALKYLARARGFNRNLDAEWACYPLPDFLKKKFRTQDPRRCVDPQLKESSLCAEVERLYESRRLNVKEIAQCLRIAPGTVTRLLEHGPQYSRTDYWKPWEILWPEGQPPRDEIRTLMGIRDQVEPRSSPRAQARRTPEGI